jgi:hypothetical protein
VLPYWIRVECPQTNMVGEPRYVPEEIYWILEKVLAKVKPDVMSEGYEARFGKDLTPTQIRYVKNKYGKDPDYKYVSKWVRS